MDRHTPDAAGLLAIARFFSTKDFAVNSKTMVKDLALGATEADFQEGNGPEVHGPLLSLVMAMAGRRAFPTDLRPRGRRLPVAGGIGRTGPVGRPR